MDRECPIDPSLVSAFERDGFVKIDGLIPPAEVEASLATYDRFLRGEIDCGEKRSDLGGDATRRDPGVENIMQIMWPSDFVPQLRDSMTYRRALEVARWLLGPDLELDFDMLIDKAPRTGTATPWHQDLAYWIDLPDRRAASCWIALDPATVENGCMWFVPGSHRLPPRQHRSAGSGGGALVCDASEDEGVPVPLAPGSCTFHHGGTLHYSRGNTTSRHRRAMIVNFRPLAMIALERARGFDHGRTMNRRTLRSDEAR